VSNCAISAPRLSLTAPSLAQPRWEEYVVNLYCFALEGLRVEKLVVQLTISLMDSVEGKRRPFYETMRTVSEVGAIQLAQHLIGMDHTSTRDENCLVQGQRHGSNV
jgi:hypothetical protein